MKISVITAVFNRAEFIEDSVLSVQAQTWPNVEHIVIDGKSNDGTIEILEKISSPSTILVSEKDEGIYDALNKGIALATGDVIGFLHSDDYYADPNVLEDIANAFRNCELGGVYSDLDYISRSDKSKIIRHWKSSAYNPKSLFYGWMPPHPTLFIRRDIYHKYGVFDKSLGISADYDAMLRYLTAKDINFLYIPRVFIKMRCGGISNASLRYIFKKSYEDFLSLKKNKVGGIFSLVCKNLRKVGQFIASTKNQPNN